ncbi:hypothetical protein IWW41_005935, partial [Coemansia sp. RSA 2522]
VYHAAAGICAAAVAYSVAQGGAAAICKLSRHYYAEQGVAVAAGSTAWRECPAA